MKAVKGIFRTGTSNIVVPGNKQSYPPQFREKSRLHYYSSFFNSLEVNSSFYKVPMPSTFKKWAQDVPAGFRFTVKFSKEITHAKELKADLAPVKMFMDAVDELGDKKGCLLIQFPGKITAAYYSRVEAILQEIKNNNNNGEWKVAVEFRHASWYIAETNELVDEYGASIVVHDIPKGRNSEPNKNAPFVFIRFHGPAGDYRGSYTNEALKIYVEKIQSWLARGKDVYAYFNNTIGNAFDNARTLQAMMKK